MEQPTAQSKLVNETSAQKSEESTLKSYYNKDLEIFNTDNKDLNNINISSQQFAMSTGFQMFDNKRYRKHYLNLKGVNCQKIDFEHIPLPHDNDFKIKRRKKKKSHAAFLSGNEIIVSSKNPERKTVLHKFKQSKKRTSYQITKQELRKSDLLSTEKSEKEMFDFIESQIPKSKYKVSRLGKQSITPLHSTNQNGSKMNRRVDRPQSIISKGFQKIRKRPCSSSLEFSNKIIASKIRVPSSELVRSVENLPFNNSIFIKALEKERKSALSVESRTYENIGEKCDKDISNYSLSQSSKQKENENQTNKDKLESILKPPLSENIKRKKHIRNLAIDNSKKSFESITDLVDDDSTTVMIRTTKNFRRNFSLSKPNKSLIEFMPRQSKKRVNAMRMLRDLYKIVDCDTNPEMHKAPHYLKDKFVDAIDSHITNDMEHLMVMLISSEPQYTSKSGTHRSKEEKAHNISTTENCSNSNKIKIINETMINQNTETEINDADKHIDANTFKNSLHISQIFEDRNKQLEHLLNVVENDLGASSSVFFEAVKKFKLHIESSTSK